MTAQQKSILITLLLGNVVFFCCLGSAAYYVYTQPSGADPLQPVINIAQSFLPATPTRRPTATPTLPVPTATMIPGWKLSVISADKFAIATPPSWEIKTLAPTNLAAQMDELAKKNPALASSLKAQPSEYVAKIKFIGYEAAASVVREGFMPNVNVMHDVETTDITLDEAVAAAQKELTSYKPNVRRVKTSAGEIAEFKFTVPMKLPNNQNVNLASTQYLILRGRDSYAISCVHLDKQAATFAPICEKIGLSFRWAN